MRLDFIKRKILIIILIIFLFFLFLNITGFSKNLKSFFYNFSSPIQKTLWQLGQRIFNPLREQEIQDLKAENQKLLFENVSLKELEKENEFLRQAINLGLEKEFKLLLSEVISKDVGEDFILINKGSDDGVGQGMPVITENKDLIGRINEVYNNYSKVMLISNKESSFTVKINNEVQGLAKGQGNFGLSLELIPQDKQVSQGDIVTTDILDKVFPKGLLVGKIAKINKSDIQPFQQAEVSILFDLKEINYLLIITNY